MYTIVLHNSTLYQFESMSLQIWNEIINILKENNVNIVDSYALIDIILHSKSTEDFYQSIEQHIEEWKQNNLAMIIKKIILSPNHRLMSWYILATNNKEDSFKVYKS